MFMHINAMNTIHQFIPENKVCLPEETLIFRDDSFVLQPFDPLTLDFLNEISRSVFSSRQINKMPAFAALAFWLRKANTSEMIHQNAHLAKDVNFNTEPRGIVFHVCPANVDTMFVYSFAMALIMGNKNIIRISSRLENEAVKHLLDLIRDVLKQEKYSIFARYIAIISYEHDTDISSWLSLQADVRILWGGDKTVEIFKSFPVKPRSKDVVFADRISCALFHTPVFLKLSLEEKKELARKFYNDSFTFDQLGCSSPQSLIFLGNNTENQSAIEELYHLLQDVALTSYQMEPYSLASLKINYMAEGICDGSMSNLLFHSNSVVFAESTKPEIMKTCGAGFFFVHRINQLKDIIPAITRKIQTLSYFGLSKDEVDELARLTFGRGIDRIVPVGAALNFDPIWDGYNLMDELCLRKRII
jgi:hypothetical protein